MIKWAGRIIAFLGVFHLLTTSFFSFRYADAWFAGELWFPDGGLAELGPAGGAFWLTPGSFGVPLALVGLLVMWLDRQGIAPPAFLAWTLGAWVTFSAVIMEPAPWVLVWVPVAMLLKGRPERVPAG